MTEPVAVTGTQLRAFYEREAEARSRGPLRGLRVQVRDAFVAQLAAEGRSSVLDAGAGPGLDGVGFRAAGLRYLGLDLAVGNGHLAAEVDVAVVQGSVTALPVRPGSFDAGWSFSTLMHLTDDEAMTAVGELHQVLRPGSPVAIGLWGREVEGSTVEQGDRPWQRRAFHLRSFEHNRALLAAPGAGLVVEAEQCHDAVGGGSDYHVFHLRTSS